MTIQQEACSQIINMSDEGAAFINQVIKTMKPTFFVRGRNATVENVSTYRRIGVAEGLFTVPDDFDDYNDEIADLFEGAAT